MSALFVYGTLMTGGAREGLLKGLRREPATVRGVLYDLPAGYPALAVGEGIVHGEVVHDVDDARLSVLDRYEGVGEGLYRRERVVVQAGAVSLAADTYVMDDPVARGGKLVPTGRWRALRRR
jgi:gamma-glutamylcyclotransferase (GGCT)/AIG2-like uncharacterized protein YtfP